MNIECFILKHHYALLFILCSAIVPASAAQTIPEINAGSAGHEIEFYSAIGLGATNGTANEANWSAGVRFGWMLTDRRRDKVFSNRFEYAIDILPLFENSQENGMGHGIEFDPAVLRWNFTPHHELQPFVELAFGIAETNIRIPPDDSRFNFTPSATVGVRILRVGTDWSIGIRYLHFSNAYLEANNPGDDSIGIRIAISRWLK
jgi:hypothetical protein